MGKYLVENVTILIFKFATNLSLGWEKEQAAEKT